MLDLAFRDLRFPRLGARRAGGSAPFSPASLFANGEAGDAWVAEREWCYTKTLGGVYEKVTTSGDLCARWKGMVNGINADQDDVTKRPVYNEGGGLSWLETDGVDDALVTGIITPGTDKAQVFAGLYKTKSSAALVAELGNSATGRLYLSAPEDAVKHYSAIATGSLPLRGDQLAEFTASGAAPDTAVITSTHDIAGDLTTIRRNSVAGASGTGDKGVGNFGNYSLSIAARAGTSLFFGGKIYGLIVRFGSNLTPEQIAATEAYLAAKSGVTL